MKPLKCCKMLRMKEMLNKKQKRKKQKCTETK